MGTFDDAASREALLDAYLHQKARRGFASMPPELRRAISSKGGKAARRGTRGAEQQSSVTPQEIPQGVSDFLTNPQVNPR